MTTDHFPNPDTSPGIVDCEACGDDGGWFVLTHKTALDGSQEQEWYPCPECHGDEDPDGLDSVEWDRKYGGYSE